MQVDDVEVSARRHLDDTNDVAVYGVQTQFGRRKSLRLSQRSRILDSENSSKMKEINADPVALPEDGTIVKSPVNADQTN